MIGVKLNNSYRTLGETRHVGEIAYLMMNSNVLTTLRNQGYFDGWIHCYGQAISRTTYNELFTFANNQGLIGSDRNYYLFGSGDGQTTFNLPDFREITFVGAGQNDTLTTVLANNHDIYGLGHFKDDCIQAHGHNYRYTNGDSKPGGSDCADFRGVYDTTTSYANSGRARDCTHSKQKGLLMVIRYKEG